MRDRSCSHQSGFSLLETLIAVGIAAMGAAVTVQVYTHGLKAQSHTTLRNDRAAIKNLILTNMDCQNTVGAIASTCNGVVPLIDKNGHAMAGFGKYTLRATCTANQGLEVQVARLKPGKAITTENSTDFYTDPLNGQPLSWANNTLFAYGDLCGTNFAPTTSPPTGSCTSCVSTPNYITQVGDLLVYPSLGPCLPMNAAVMQYVHGTAMCPAGWRPTISSAGCENMILGGVTLANTFTPDGQGVRWDCCVITDDEGTADGQLLPGGAGAIVVGCVPEILGP